VHGFDLHDGSIAHAVDAAVAPTDLENETISANLAAQLERAEIALPSELLKTWELRKRGLDYQSISRELEIPVGTVKSRFARIVDYMRKEMINEP